MKPLILTGDELLSLGFEESPALGRIIKIARFNYRENQREKVMQLLAKLLQKPEDYAEDKVWSPVADALKKVEPTEIQLQQNPGYSSFGADQIEEGAKLQMSVAMQLPVAVAGALMPDAHHGYGLPIGGVLAVKNAVIPYGVGVDIGCRMSLSVFDIPSQDFAHHRSKFKRELIANTAFGAGNGFKGAARAEHAVLEDPAFDTTLLLKSLKDKARDQLGSSGSGNHFVEFGFLELPSAPNELNIPAGRYLALLSHSGSRGLGATIANHYTKLARSVCLLPKEAAHLAYFDLNSEAGQEYWIAMNLAGDYAAANHQVIHQKISDAIGGQVIAHVGNHHNFAWKERYDGQELIVHRKGATPADSGILGIIPGSMAAPGYLVRGKGFEAALRSASHGAGRKMSRTRARNSFTSASIQDLLKSKGITLIGGGTDEAPGAYKDIREVMRAQEDLVDIVGTFQPKLVIMDK